MINMKQITLTKTDGIGFTVIYIDSEESEFKREFYDTYDQAQQAAKKLTVLL